MQKIFRHSKTVCDVAISVPIVWKQIKKILHLLEILIVLNNGITNLDTERTALFESLLLEQWFQHWIQLFQNVLQQHLNNKTEVVFQIRYYVLPVAVCIYIV